MQPATVRAWRSYLLRLLPVLLNASLLFGQQIGTFNETLDVEVVNLDVVVRDRDGKFVGDLAREEFLLLVDGKRVEISNFSAYLSERTSVSRRPAERVLSTPRRPVDDDVQLPPPATWLVYVDMLRIPRFQRVQALQQVQTFLETTLRPGDHTLVACFDGDAFRVLHPLTTELRTTTRALTALQRRAAPSREFLPSLYGDQFGEAEDRERSVRASLDGLQHLVALVGGLEGRTALLLVGGGYKLSDFDMLTSSRLNTVYRRLLDRLTESRITVYSIFSGPDRFPGYGADVSSDRLPRGSESEQPPPAFAGVVEGSSEIAAFAEETGGIAFIGASDLSRRLTGAQRDFEDYYSLGFRAPERSAGKRLRIEARILRPGLVVRHRRAVRLRTDEEIAHGANTRALLSRTPPNNSWGIELVVAQRPKDRRQRHAQLEIRIPIDHIQFADGGEHRAGRLQIHFAASDSKGNYRHVETKDLPLEVSPEELARLRKSGIRYTIQLLLAPGSTDLSVTVWDVIGRTGSTARAAIRA